MRWAGHVARLGKVCTEFWWGNLRERDHWGDPDVNGRIILTWVFRKWEGLWGLQAFGSGEGQVAGSCEYGNELSSSMKCGEFLDWLQNQLSSQEGLCSME
jgi:hypothetical protein